MNGMLGCASAMENQKWKPENRINVADIVILVKFTMNYPYLNSFIRILFTHLIWMHPVSETTKCPTGCDVEILGCHFVVFRLLLFSLQMFNCSEIRSQMCNMDFGLTVSKWTKHAIIRVAVIPIRNLYIDWRDLKAIVLAYFSNEHSIKKKIIGKSSYIP